MTKDFSAADVANVCLYSLKVLITCSSEVSLRPCMKSAGDFEKDTGILELLLVDPTGESITTHLVCGLLLCHANREVCCMGDDAL